MWDGHPTSHRLPRKPSSKYHCFGGRLAIFSAKFLYSSSIFTDSLRCWSPWQLPYSRLNCQNCPKITRCPFPFLCGQSAGPTEHRRPKCQQQLQKRAQQQQQKYAVKAKVKNILIKTSTRIVHDTYQQLQKRAKQQKQKYKCRQCKN